MPYKDERKNTHFSAMMRKNVTQFPSENILINGVERILDTAEVIVR
ncbi:MAG: hypothetical protein OXE59_07330 [Bacteroidetes bacterium]|nr:hypothetical protein [Bacteroidota bacterium]